MKPSLEREKEKGGEDVQGEGESRREREYAKPRIEEGEDSGPSQHLGSRLERPSTSGPRALPAATGNNSNSRHLISCAIRWSYSESGNRQRERRVV